MDTIYHCKENIQQATLIHHHNDFFSIPISYFFAWKGSSIPTSYFFTCQASALSFVWGNHLPVPPTECFVCNAAYFCMACIVCLISLFIDRDVWHSSPKPHQKPSPRILPIITMRPSQRARCLNYVVSESPTEDREWLVCVFPSVRQFVKFSLRFEDFFFCFCGFGFGGGLRSTLFLVV